MDTGADAVRVAGSSERIIRMRFLILVTITVAILATATVLAAGYLDGEFSAPSDGLAWLRSLIEAALT